MRDVTVLVKPASSACDLRCSYCFYRDEAAHRLVPNRGIMKQPVLEKTVQAALSAAEARCTFLFQGGEPTLAGLDFYREFLALEKKYAKPGTQVFHSIQTNGLGLDETWARFLAKNRFLTGLSLDGPAQLHDAFRVDGAGEGTFRRVADAAGRLQKYGADFNILCVVTAKSARAPEELYRFFRRFPYLQFIPCLEPLGCPPGSREYSLSPQDYGDFLVKVFDLWFRDLLEGKYVSIRHLDNWIGILLRMQPEACNMTGRCAVGFTVESDGEVYPCDFYALDEWRLGNILTDSLEQMAASPTAQRFVQESLAVPGECRTCRYYPLCRNGCRRDRVSPPSGGPEKTFLCEAYKRFFAQREGPLIRAARIIGALRKSI